MEETKWIRQVGLLHKIDAHFQMNVNIQTYVHHMKNKNKHSVLYVFSL